MHGAHRVCVRVQQSSRGPIHDTLQREHERGGIGVEFPDALGRRFSVIVERPNNPGAQLVVECARHASANGQLWSSGMTALGTPLPPVK